VLRLSKKLIAILSG